MARYITTDTTTAEIVHESNRHPAMEPLARSPAKRRVSPQGAWDKLDADTRAIIAVAAVLGLLAL